MPRTTSRVNKGAQVKATAAAKRGRVKEAGLGGRRVGAVSTNVRSAQARRDAKGKGAVVAPVATAKGRSAVAANQRAAEPKARKHRTSALIEVRTGSSVEGSARLDAFAEEVVRGALSRFMPRLTRIDIHLSDANAGKTGGDDKRCQIEVRPASRQPVSATATAPTIKQALATAVANMKRLLAKRLDRRVRG